MKSHDNCLSEGMTEEMTLNVHLALFLRKEGKC